MATDPSILAMRAGRNGGTGWLTRRRAATGTPIVVTFTVQPTIVGSGLIGSNHVLNFGTAPGAVLAGVLRRGGTILIASVTNGQTYVPVAGDDLGTLTLDVTATIGLVTAGASATKDISYATPAFSVQPSLFPTSIQAGAILTLTLGVASPAVTYTIEEFSLNGVDKRTGLVQTGPNTFTWDSVAQPAGSISYRVRATNTKGFALSAVQTASVGVAGSVPTAFAPADWTFADVPSASGNTMAINILTLPANGGSAITALQYSLNGGAWTALSGLGTGARNITVPATTLASVEIRAVNSTGPALTSGAKTGTPTITAAAPTFLSAGVVNNQFQYQTSGVARLYIGFDDGAALTQAQLAAGTNQYAFQQFTVAAGSNAVSLSMTNVPPGARKLRAMLSTVGQTNYGAIQTFDINVAAAPSLTGVAVAQTGTTTASGTITTDTNSGTLYVVRTTSATSPSKAQIRAGQNNAGTAAAHAAGLAIITAGSKSVPATGLTAGTTYYTYFMHENGAGTQSTIIAAGAITTASVDTTAPILTSPTGTQTGTTTATGNVTTDEGAGLLWRVTTLTATTPTRAQVKAGQNAAGGAGVASLASVAVSAAGLQTLAGITGLTAGVTYYNHYVQEDAASPINGSNVATSAAFTTAVSGSTELFTDPGCDNAVRWDLATNMSITGSRVVFASPANFAAMTQTQGFWTPITGGVNYTFKVDLKTLGAGGAKLVKMKMACYIGATYASGNATPDEVALTSNFENFTTTGIKTYTFTAPSNATTGRLIIQVADEGGNTFEFDDFSVKAT